MITVIIQKHNFSHGADLPSPSKSGSIESITMASTIAIVVVIVIFSRFIVTARHWTISFLSWSLLFLCLACWQSCNRIRVRSQVGCHLYFTFSHLFEISFRWTRCANIYHSLFHATIFNLNISEDIRIHFNQHVEPIRKNALVS